MAPGKTLITTMNLCLPGLGQLFAGRWILGTVILLSSILFFLAGTFYAMEPLFHFINTMLTDSNAAVEVKFNLAGIAVSYGIVIILWFFSILEGIWHTGKKKEKENE